MQLCSVHKGMMMKTKDELQPLFLGFILVCYFQTQGIDSIF